MSVREHLEDLTGLKGPCAVNGGRIFPYAPQNRTNSASLKGGDPGQSWHTQSIGEEETQNLHRLPARTAQFSVTPLAPQATEKFATQDCKKYPGC